MLVLRRKVGERIMIDGRIEVTVLRVRGGKVRLGFAAPNTVCINREENTHARAARSSDQQQAAETVAASAGSS